VRATVETIADLLSEEALARAREVVTRFAV
jgi:hypothetical protein